jgi:hypothetical protein
MEQDEPGMLATLKERLSGILALLDMFLQAIPI